MWVKTKDKLIDAIVFKVNRNLFSKKKYAITAMCASGGLSSEPQIVAAFNDKEQANAELDRIVAAINSEAKVYHIAEENYPVD